MAHAPKPCFVQLLGGIRTVETTTTKKHMETGYSFTSLVRGQPAEHSQLHSGMFHFDTGVTKTKRERQHCFVNHSYQLSC